MKISEAIAIFEKIKEKEGDINVCISESHEYWGSCETYLKEYSINVVEHAQPHGPKSGKSEKAIVLSYD